MEYEILGGDLPQKYKGHQDPIFHIDERFELAKGDGWIAELVVRGEVSIHKNGEWIDVEDVITEYDTDDKLNAALDSGELEYQLNNWYEIEFWKENRKKISYDYMDLVSDDCVVFSFEEALEVLENYLNDEQFQRELKEEVMKGNN